MTTQSPLWKVVSLYYKKSSHSFGQEPQVSCGVWHWNISRSSGFSGLYCRPPMSSKDQACCDITLSDWGLLKSVQHLGFSVLCGNIAGFDMRLCLSKGLEFPHQCFYFSISLMPHHKRWSFWVYLNSSSVSNNWCFSVLEFQVTPRGKHMDSTPTCWPSWTWFLHVTLGVGGGHPPSSQGGGTYVRRTSHSAKVNWWHNCVGVICAYEVIPFSWNWVISKAVRSSYIIIDIYMAHYTETS